MCIHTPIQESSLILEMNGTIKSTIKRCWR